MSRLPRLLRALHTGGRHIPNPGQGGAPPQTSISPSPSTTYPSPSASASGLDIDSSLDPTYLGQSSHSSPSTSDHSTSNPYTRQTRFTPKGKPIPHRPARKIPVQLPSGHLEPPSYPPPAEYIASVRDPKRPAPKLHPLWQFFHVPSSSQAELDSSATSPPDGGSLDVLLDDESNLDSGRSWSAAELRQKSFADLHLLWYVLLKERNVLATQKEERRRLEIRQDESGDMVTKRGFRCRKSMARIKYVLNERRLGLIAAAAPLVPGPSPDLPYSAVLDVDPAAGIAALRDQVKVPLEVLRGPPRVGAQPAVSEDGDFMESAEGESVLHGAVPYGEVAKEEVEARDEGFGGGHEAKQFVEEVQVGEDGKVEKKL